MAGIVAPAISLLLGLFSSLSYLNVPLFRALRTKGSCYVLLFNSDLSLNIQILVDTKDKILYTKYDILSKNPK